MHDGEYNEEENVTDSESDVGDSMFTPEETHEYMSITVKMLILMFFETNICMLSDDV